MIEYVLGFAFTNNDLLVALRKNGKLKNLEGKLNGPGGKVEPDETPRAAMSREFHEETGVLIPSFQWNYMGRVKASDGSYAIYLYTHKSDDFLQVSTQTEEEVMLLNDWRASAKEMDGLFLAFTAMIQEGLLKGHLDFKEF